MSRPTTNLPGIGAATGGVCVRDIRLGHAFIVCALVVVVVVGGLPFWGARGLPGAFSFLAMSLGMPAIG